MKNNIGTTVLILGVMYTSGDSHPLGSRENLLIARIFLFAEKQFPLNNFFSDKHTDIFLHYKVGCDKKLFFNSFKIVNIIYSHSHIRIYPKKKRRLKSIPTSIFTKYVCNKSCYEDYENVEQLH